MKRKLIVGFNYLHRLFDKTKQRTPAKTEVYITYPHQSCFPGTHPGPVSRYGVNSSRGQGAFTLVELLIYAAVFSVTAGLLTSILVMISNIQTKESASFEVTRQLQFVTQTIQYAIRDASIIDGAYEGSTGDSVTANGTPCVTFCSIKLLVADNTKSPTIISSDVAGVYIKEGASQRVALTSPSVKINSLEFNKIDTPGGIATVTVDLALVYDGGSPELTIAKALSSAIAHVSAATFDSDLLPDTDGGRSIGGSSLKWRDITLSGGLTISGPAGVGEYAGITMSRSTTHGTSSFSQYYVTGTPDKYGTHFDVGGTPLLYLEADSALSTRRAYLLNGNFGVGTTNPLAKFVSRGTAINGLANFISTTSGYGPVVVGTGNYVANDIAAIDFDIADKGGIARIGAMATAGGSYLIFGTSNSYATGGTNRVTNTAMVIDYSGNVGIGNATPSYKLDVSGDLRITGTPYRTGGDIAWQVPSDARLKNVSGEYSTGLKEIISLTPVRYRYKPNESLKLTDSKEYVGIIAQEAERLIPEAVSKDKDGYLSLNTTPIFWAMINAIKELGAGSDEFRVELRKKDKEINNLRMRIEALEAGAGR